MAPLQPTHLRRATAYAAYKASSGIQSQSSSVSMSQKSAIISEPSDLLFYAALALLPVDGTVAGIPLPYWTPLSPWLFLAYALVNARLLRTVARRYLPFVLFPLLLVLLSFYGWTTIGFHGWAAARSIGSVVLGLACLASLEIALRIKRLPWKPMVTVLVATYGYAFVVGAVQWGAIHLSITSAQKFFEKLMYRQYITADSPWGEPRSQFLFAEPSYIGMHLYGVLLPVYWMIRPCDRTLAKRVATIIVVFAVGSLLLGAGVRIILDSLVALGIVIVESTVWRTRKGRRWGVTKLLGLAGISAVAVVVNQRVSLILRDGWNGDGSFSARIWQSIGPLMGVIRHPANLIVGYGSGNLAQAAHDGAYRALGVLKQLGISTTGPDRWYASVTPNAMFTMSAYTSFIVEFGLLGFGILLVLLLTHVTANHSWNKMIICWLVLLGYLYLQFEGYSFYAIPLFIWSVRRFSSVERTL